MLRNYIGLANSFHDSALAIVNSHGEVIFAEATERSLQSKRALCMTPDLVHHAGDVIRQYCEPGAAIVIARSWEKGPVHLPEGTLRSLDERRFTLEKRYGKIPEGLQTELSATKHGVLSMWKAKAFAGQNIEFELDRIGWARPFIEREIGYDHHLTHAAAACFGSPFRDAACAIVDALGEDTATAFFSYRDGALTPFYRQASISGGQGFSGLASLGLFYVKVCLACGFGVHTGEEWKVMGLAAYGSPNQKLLSFFRRMIRVNGLSLETENEGDEERLALYKLRRAALNSEEIAADVAFAGQQIFADTLIELLNNFYKVGNSQNLVLGGGCALNSSVNGLILERTPFKELYAFCAPADDGNAVGAAQLAHREDHPVVCPKPQLQSP